MKEISQNPSYIRIIAFVENWMGKKMYSTHIIMLNKYIKKNVEEFMRFAQTHFPTIEFVEIVNK